MADEQDVLAANRAFYQAFKTRDLGAMDQLWARSVEVVCVHPGWDALRGREPVMASWRDILANETGPAIQCADEQVLVHGDMAFVLCHELIGSGLLVATNLFVREEGAWRMVQHHAGPVSVRTMAAPRRPQRLH